MEGSKRILRRRSRAVKEAKAVDSGKVRVVGYMRVSTDGQFMDGFGLDVQENSIRAFAESQGYELVDMIADRASGITPPPDRPGFAKLMKLAESGAFSILLVYRFDRLARSVIHAITAVHTMRDRFGIVLRSVTEPIDTATPMGEMIFTILAGMAAQERMVIVERTWGGRKEKAKSGGIACGPPPFGYSRDEDGELVVVPREAETVREIFRMRREGAMLREIVAALNAAGKQTRKGSPWSIATVHYFLDNPKYTGNVEFLFSDDTHVFRKGRHEAIV